MQFWAKALSARDGCEERWQRSCLGGEKVRSEAGRVFNSKACLDCLNFELTVMGAKLEAYIEQS